MNDQPLKGSTAQTVVPAAFRTKETILAASATWVNLTPAAMAFVSDVAEEEDFGLFTAAAHGMLVGLKVRVASATTLPDGLAAATDYFVIPVSANTFRLATSLVNANAGTAIVPVDAGTGVHTLTPTALNVTVKLQSSINGTRWTDVASTNETFTADADNEFTVASYLFPYARWSIVVTAGQFSYDHVIVTK